MKALILNSGLGHRMGAITKEPPKCTSLLFEKTMDKNMRSVSILHKLGLLELVIILSSLATLVSCDKLPEDVIITEIPNYYFENDYLDNRVDAINNAIVECSDSCETFFWITDMHWEPDLNTRVSPLLIKYIASKTGINKILNGGDTGNSQVICKNAILQLRNAIGSNNVYTVNGNHEIADATNYEKPFDRVAEELRGHNDDIFYGDRDKSYFYFDDNKKKTRYIGLSSFGLYINEDYESCYTNEQLLWFKNDALCVNQGWSIVIFSHTLYYVSIDSDLLYPSPTGAENFIDVIDNYKGNGSIVCVLMGHAHKDRIHIGSSSVPYIISASDRHAPYQGDINVQRVPGTISEQHFETVVIDKKNRLIKLFSIGANARDGYDNDPGKEVDVRIVNY